MINKLKYGMKLSNHEETVKTNINRILTIYKISQLEFIKFLN